MKKWSDEEIDRLHKRFIIRVFIFIPLLMVMIFLLAGRINYWQGWGLGIAYLITKLIELTNKELVVERAHPGPGIKWWDKLFLLIYGILGFGLIVLGVLDTGRFFWSPTLPWYLYLLGYICFVISIWLMYWAMRTNKFFSSLVRIQTDRGHHVVQTGPYSIVRHPGYVSVFFSYTGMPLVLGSLWCFIPTVLAIVAVIIRTYLEDNLLKRELEGYLEYSEKVKYRLIPKIW